MKKIEVVIRSDRSGDLKDALSKVGSTKGMIVSQVLGYGNQRGFTEYVRGQEIVPTLLAKVKVEIVTRDATVDEIVDIICKVARIGGAGSGKIFILPIEEVVRIRTEERGGDAV